MTPIINSETTNYLKKMLKKDVFSSLIEIYVKDTQKYIFDLEQCLNQNNAQDAYRLAHTIKGSSANMGATELCKTCEAVELLCKQGNLQGAKNHMPNLHLISQQTLNEMRRFAD
jgi:HPt (histidine-containing phosphotransfer) domain-containing protein